MQRKSKLEEKIKKKIIVIQRKKTPFMVKVAKLLYQRGAVFYLCNPTRYGDCPAVLFTVLKLSFREETGFNSVMVFVDSRKLFDDLRESWMDVQLLKIVSGTPMEAKDYEDIFKWLPKDKQEEIMAKQKVFASRAGGMVHN